MSLTGSLLGVYVQNMRKARGWSMGQLSEISGVPKSQISRLENGVYWSCREDNLVALAQAFGEDVNTLRELALRPAMAPPKEVIDVIGEFPSSLGVVPDRDQVLMQSIASIRRALTIETDLHVVNQLKPLLDDLTELLKGGSPKEAQESLLKANSEIKSAIDAFCYDRHSHE